MRNFRLDQFNRRGCRISVSAIYDHTHTRFSTSTSNLGYTRKYPTVTVTQMLYRFRTEMHPLGSPEESVSRSLHCANLSICVCHLVVPRGVAFSGVHVESGLLFSLSLSRSSRFNYSRAARPSARLCLNKIRPPHLQNGFFSSSNPRSILNLFILMGPYSE